MEQRTGAPNPRGGHGRHKHKNSRFSTGYKVFIGILIIVLVGLITYGWLRKHGVAVLQPAGPVAADERRLLLFAAGLSLVVIIPVFTLLFAFLWRYRESDPKGRYTPELQGSRLAETIWWFVPTALILILGVVIWRSSYALDPYRAVASAEGAKPLTIQVVALDWKWLFIYPDRHIASVNDVALPVGRPVRFELTSDTVMTSLFIAKLGSQMYAMPGMTTQLNLRADQPGTYPGIAANISGKGFSAMRFTAQALNAGDYQAWIARAAGTDRSLNDASYAELSKQSIADRPAYYGSVQNGLFDSIVMKYMMPMHGDHNTMTMAGMQ